MVVSTSFTGMSKLVNVPVYTVSYLILFDDLFRKHQRTQTLAHSV